MIFNLREFGVNYRHLCPGPRGYTVGSCTFSSATAVIANAQTLRFPTFYALPPLRSESGAFFGQKWYFHSGLAHLRSQTLGFCRADRASNPQADKSNFLRPIYSILFLGSSRTTVNRPPKCEFHEFGGPFLRRSALRLERGPLFYHNLITTVKYE